MKGCLRIGPLIVMFEPSSAAVQPEDGDGAHPVPEGEAAGGTPGLPHRAAGPPGGTFTPAGRQQSPQQ